MSTTPNPLTGTNVLAPGGAPPPGEPMEGDSLTQWLRGQISKLNNTGQDITNTGGSLLKSGGAGYAAGNDTVNSGLNTLNDPKNYFASILSGDPTRMAAAAAPAISAVRANYDNAAKSVSQLQPRGGFRSTTMAELPFQKSAQINNTLLAQQPAAATSLANIGTGVAGIGLGQQSAGIGQEGVGVNEQSLGLQQLLAAIQAQLQRRGQNISETGQNKQLASSMFGDYTKAMFA